MDVSATMQVQYLQDVTVYFYSFFAYYQRKKNSFVIYKINNIHDKETKDLWLHLMSVFLCRILR